MQHVNQGILEMVCTERVYYVCFCSHYVVLLTLVIFTSAMEVKLSVIRIPQQLRDELLPNGTG